MDYWLPDPDIKPTKFKIVVMRPDNKGQLKVHKKARSFVILLVCVVRVAYA